MCFDCVHLQTKLLVFTFLQFSSSWYLCARKNLYALYHVSRKFPQHCLRHCSNVRLIDDGTFSLSLSLSSFQGRSFSASSFHACHLQAVDGVMSLALCPQVEFQAPQHFISSETQATCEVCFSRESVCSVVSLHSSMSRAVHPLECSKLDWGGGGGGGRGAWGENTPVSFQYSSQSAVLHSKTMVQFLSANHAVELT